MENIIGGNFFNKKRKTRPSTPLVEGGFQSKKCSLKNVKIGLDMGSTSVTEKESPRFADKKSRDSHYGNEIAGMTEPEVKEYLKNRKTYHLTGNLIQWMRWAFPEDFKAINEALRPAVDEGWRVIGDVYRASKRLKVVLRGYVPASDTGSAKIRNCKYCGRAFPATRSDRMFCSHNCRVYYGREKRKAK